MTKNLLVVFNIGNEDSVCEQFLPYWQRSGCDILCSSTLDDPSKLKHVQHVRFGERHHSKRQNFWRIQSRMLDTFKYCLDLKYSGFWFTQFDSVALGTLPELKPKDLFGHVFSNDDAQFKADFFIHPPWGFGIEKLAQFVDAAKHYDIQTTEHGMADRWMALIMQDAGMVVTSSNEWTYSANAIDTQERVSEARMAVMGGGKFIHGVKDPEVLALILSPLHGNNAE